VTGGLPVVLQDGENTYVYGLALISATDGQGDQVYYLYDGLGSVTEVTDENGNVVAVLRV
jgi:YD repeat-containing protein